MYLPVTPESVDAATTSVSRAMARLRRGAAAWPGFAARGVQS
jgi:hypothetical protein